MSVYPAGYHQDGSAVPGGRHAVWQRPIEQVADGRPQRWPLLADDLFRVVHDDRGAPVLHDDVVAVGLAAALLAELVLTERVAVHAGRLSVVTTTSPIDTLANIVLAEVRDEETELPVRDWIAYLAGESLDRVARRMEQAGHLQAQTRRSLRTFGLSRITRYRPTSMNDAGWPWARLSRLVDREQGFDRFDTGLAGLILAVGLHRKLLVEPGIDIERELRGRVQYARPELQELLSITEALVGDRVIVG